MELKWLNVLPSVLVLLHLHVSVVSEDPISSARAVLDDKKLCYNQTSMRVRSMGLRCIACLNNIAFSYSLENNYFYDYLCEHEHNLFFFEENVVFAFAVQKVARVFSHLNVAGPEKWDLNEANFILRYKPFKNVCHIKINVNVKLHWTITLD